MISRLKIRSISWPHIIHVNNLRYKLAMRRLYNKLVLQVRHFFCKLNTCQRSYKTLQHNSYLCSIYGSKSEVFLILLNAFLVLSLMLRVSNLLIFRNSHSIFNIKPSLINYFFFFNNIRVYWLFVFLWFISLTLIGLLVSLINKIFEICSILVSLDYV